MSRPEDAVHSERWPTTAEQVTAEWLQRVLRRNGFVVTIESLARSRVGTGQVGECWLFELEVAEGNDRCPRSLVVKLAATDPASRAAGQSQSCYVREVGFYRDLQKTVRIRTPRCYFAAIAENQTDHVLVLEDMAPARPGDQLAGCSVDDAAKALEQLALLHGPRWGDPALLSIDWLEAPSAENRAQLVALFEALCGGFLDRFGARLVPEAERVVRWLSEHLGNLEDDESPLTPVHNDYRVDNMLFGDGESAPELTVVDWQTLKLGSGPRDAAYFLGAGLRTEARRSCERSLVRDHYYRNLVEAGVQDFSFEDCWLQYRRGAFGGVLMAVIASMLVGETQRGDEMFLTMARRHSRHVVDLDAIAAVT